MPVARWNVLSVFAVILVAGSGCSDSTAPEELFVPDSVNVLLNAGFENGIGDRPDNWHRVFEDNPPPQHVSFAWDGTETHRGNRSISVGIAESHWPVPASYYWYQLINAGFQPGGSYEVSAWIKTHGVSETPLIWLTFHDHEGETIDSMDTSHHFWVYGTSDWTYVEAPFTVPAATAYIHMRVGLKSPADIGGAAWFDDLAIEPDEPRSGTATVNAAWSSWIQDSSHTIASLTSDDYSDLQFLKPLLGDRRLVQLGESGHGVAEFNVAKVRLIKFLHEEMGFDVIAFESPLFGCFVTDAAMQTLTAEQALIQSLVGVWRAEETLALFDYIKESKQTDRPLVLAGFDEQPAFQGSIEQRPGFLGEVVAHIDGEYADSVIRLDSAFVHELLTDYDTLKAYAKDNEQDLMPAYVALVDTLDAYEATLQDIYIDNPAIPKVARQTVWSISRSIARMAADSRCDQYMIRDSAMATNVDFLLNELFPDKKIVSWAHNYHVRHDNRHIDADPCAPQSSMGTWIAERHRTDLYTVGLYMYQGHAATNARTIYEISRSKPNSVERVMHETGYTYSFVDMLFQTEVAGNSWMFNQVEALDWGRYPELIVPRDQYDGILFIEDVQPPNYIN